jgi:hypothetical protein
LKPDEHRRVGWKRFSIASLIHLQETNMLAIRLYISALTLFFLVVVLSYRDLGILEGVVICCALVYLILDARDELQEIKSELGMLNDLEQHVYKLLGLNS